MGLLVADGDFHVTMSLVVGASGSGVSSGASGCLGGPPSPVFASATAVLPGADQSLVPSSLEARTRAS